MRRATLFILGAGLAGCLVEIDPPGASKIPPRVQSAFDGNCVVKGCHDADTAKNGLSLAAGDSDAILGGSALGSDLPLVDIGNLDGSYIAQKLLDGPDIVGSQMPPGGGDEEDIAVILGWIAGAPLSFDEDLSFEADVWPILEANCGCHADPDDDEPSGPLELPDQATAYMNLVGVEAAYSFHGDPLDYIEPGEPKKSWVWQAVSGAGPLTMPFGTDGLEGNNLLTIRAWILAGAPP